MYNSAGKDVGAQFRRGAAETCRLAAFFGCRAALLKERSPSCGSGVIYDGSFTGTLRDGDGLTAAALKAVGIAVYGETQLRQLL